MAKAGPPAESGAKPVATLVASRPPVPLVTPPKTNFFTQATAEKPASDGKSAALTSDSKSINLGVFNSNPPPSDPSQPGQQADATPQKGDDSQARKAIEFDGYRNVRGLEKAPDGTWRGRAMRGRTEIAVKVDATGNVSAE
jgi:hypothetical protein